jgi:integrase/recombinase XerD
VSARERLSIRFPDWPAADQAAWQLAIQPGGLFDDQGPAAHWAASTRRSVQYDYGIWLRWCVHNGVSLTPTIDARVTPEHVRDFIAHLELRISTVTLHSNLARLCQAMTVLCPASDWHWLKRIVNRLERLKVPITDKASRVQDSGALLALGHSLMASATQPSEKLPRKTRLHAAIQYRDGLMLALLATRPLRRTNFAGIRLEDHLYKVDQTWWLRFNAGETKQGRLIEQPIPTRLHSVLDTYLDTYRLCFPGAARHTHLWASAKGGPLTSEGFYQAIIKRTRHEFGKPVNPHLFRDCAATTIARHTPEQVSIASQILGHSKLATSERHYNQADSASASRQYQSALAAIRASTQSRSGKAR